MNRTFKPNRQGITLLFVISMIVLFLLMGTAFVTVANNFNRESKNRILSKVPEGDGSQLSNSLLDRMMLQVIRGPNLRNIDSPLRGNDLLSDQYGYGVKSFVSDDITARMAGDGAFVEISLRSDITDQSSEDEGINLLDESTVALAASDFEVSNSSGGRVLSFTTGPAKGFSARIYTDYYESGTHVFRVPTASITGAIITDDVITDPDFIGSEVIINGRDFSGTGAAVILDANLNPTGLGMQALLPNRVGQLYDDFAGITGGTDDEPIPPTASYLAQTRSSGDIEPNSASVNEGWDAADIANIHLSGFGKGGDFIPSFYRQSLIDNGPASTPDAGRTFFHAFDEGADDMPDVDTDGNGAE